VRKIVCQTGSRVKSFYHLRFDLSHSKESCRPITNARKPTIFSAVLTATVLRVLCWGCGGWRLGWHVHFLNYSDSLRGLPPPFVPRKVKVHAIVWSHLR